MHYGFFDLTKTAFFQKASRLSKKTAFYQKSSIFNLVKKTYGFFEKTAFLSKKNGFRLRLRRRREAFFLKKTAGFQKTFGFLKRSVSFQKTEGFLKRSAYSLSKNRRFFEGAGATCAILSLAALLCLLRQRLSLGCFATPKEIRRSGC